MENTSEIARLRLRIEEEYTAAWRALHEVSMVAKHEFITARMEDIHHAHEELQVLLGKEEAIKLVAATLEHVQEVKVV